MTLQKLRDFLMMVEGSLDQKEMLKTFVEGIKVIALGDPDYGDSSEVEVDVNQVTIHTFLLNAYATGGDLQLADGLVVIDARYDYFELQIVCKVDVLECASVTFTLGDGEEIELFIDDCEVLGDGECLCTVVVPVKEDA